MIDVDMVITSRYVTLDMIINVLDLNFSYFKQKTPSVLMLSAVPMDGLYIWQVPQLCVKILGLTQGLIVGFVINRYFRSGAPPVINPLYTSFPRDTVIPGSFAVTLTWTLPNRTTGAFNVTSPLPGDWFLAAHLPKDEGKISVKVSLNIYHKSPS